MWLPCLDGMRHLQNVAPAVCSRRGRGWDSIGWMQASDGAEGVAVGSPGAAGWAVVVALLIVAMLYLLYFQLEPSESIWQVPRGRSVQQMIALRLGRLDQQVTAAAAGENLELHFVGFDPAIDTQARMLGVIYFRANYTLQPRRAWVSRGDRVINTADDVVREDVVPGDAWLREHDVRNVLTMIRSEGPVGEEVRAVR